MKCANPECRRDAHDLQHGILRLLEMEVPPEERLEGNDYGFPVCKVPSRFFWLCATCSRILRMKGWTANGVILEPSLPQQKKPVSAAMDLEIDSGESYPLMGMSLQTLA